MPELRLDNLDVRTSGLTQRGFRAAFCDLLLPITPENGEQMLAEFKREGELGGKYSGMRIYGKCNFPSVNKVSHRSLRSGFY
jgi:hypothetical protein